LGRGDLDAGDHGAAGRFGGVRRIAEIALDLERGGHHGPGAARATDAELERRRRLARQRVAGVALGGGGAGAEQAAEAGSQCGRPDHSAMSAAILTETMWSGSRTGSPRLIWSTFSMPSITLPHTVYWRSRKR